MIAQGSKSIELPFTFTFWLSWKYVIFYVFNRIEKQVHVVGQSVSCTLTCGGNGLAVHLFCYPDF